MSLSFESPKDPDEVLDYKLDWTARLDGDTIASSIWLLADGIVKESDEGDSASTTIWLSGGTEGQAYALTNRITTAGGRTMDQTVKLKVKSK